MLRLTQLDFKKLRSNRRRMKAKKRGIIDEVKFTKFEETTTKTVKGRQS